MDLKDSDRSDFSCQRAVDSSSYSVAIILSLVSEVIKANIQYEMYQIFRVVQL